MLAPSLGLATLLCCLVVVGGGRMRTVYRELQKRDTVQGSPAPAPAAPAPVLAPAPVPALAPAPAPLQESHLAVLRLAQVTQEMAHLLGEQAGLQGPGQLLAPEFVADTQLVQRISPAASPAAPAVSPAVSPAVTPAAPAVPASKQLELLHTALALAARLTEHNRQLAAAALSLAAGEKARAGARSSAEAGLVSRLAVHAATLASRVAETKTRLLAPLLREARRLMTAARRAATAATSAARRYQLEADVAQLGRGVAAVTSQLVRAQGGLARKVARELGHVTARLRPVARKVGAPHQLL